MHGSSIFTLGVVFCFGMIIAGSLSFYYFKLKIANFKHADEFNQLESEHKVLLGKHEILVAQNEDSFKRQKVYENDYTQLRDKHIQLETRFDEKEKSYLEAQENMQGKFQELAGRLLDDTGLKIEKRGIKTIEEMIAPLKEDMGRFKNRLESVHTEDTKQRTSLEQQVKNLMQLNDKMSKETASLTKALIGDNKTQGDWGEFQVEMILQDAGLRSGEEYIAQGEKLALKSETGVLLKPDFLIKVPGEKHLIIDSKVSLKAYTSYVNTDDDKERAVFIKAHLNSVIAHIDELAAKHYHMNDRINSPDFVLMFLPIEPAYALAISLKNDLFSYSWKKKVIVVTPTNLFAVMKTVASIWKIEKQNNNAAEIAKRGAALYDKVYLLIDDMREMGKHLSRAQVQFDGTMNKLSEGKGNLISQVQKLEELGIKPKKSIAL